MYEKHLEKMVESMEVENKTLKEEVKQKSASIETYEKRVRELEFQLARR